MLVINDLFGLNEEPFKHPLGLDVETHRKKVIQSKVEKIKIRYKCANCGFVFDELLTNFNEKICPKCTSNAIDKHFNK